MAEVSEFFRTMLAWGASHSSLRSYGLALLRWWRILAAVDVPWQRAGRMEVRGFVLWMRLVGPQDRAAGYAPATINHALAVLKTFYADRAAAGQGPLVNPVPDAGIATGDGSSRTTTRCAPFAPGARAPFRPKLPERVPRSLPDSLFDSLFAAVGSIGTVHRLAYVHYGNHKRGQERQDRYAILAGSLQGRARKKNLGRCAGAKCPRSYHWARPDSAPWKRPVPTGSWPAAA
ncbi:MAG: site-specific integrase [Humibacillus sp.]|nr:site-specific integrase [Humibacillus sp.]